MAKPSWARIREAGGEWKPIRHGKGTTHPPIAETAYQECGGCTGTKKQILEGILTAANSIYWPTLSALVEACVGQGKSIAVADHGLNADHRKELEDQGVIILDKTLERMTAAHIKASEDQTTNPVAPPAAWFKPWVCSASPFQRSVWIDSDAVPLGAIDHLFEMTRIHSWITRNSVVVNNQLMYRKFVDAAGNINEDRYGVACQINTGVFGFHHNDKWIESWKVMVKRILDHPELASLSNVRDQSAAVLLFSSTEESMPNLIWDEAYNYPANRKNGPGVEKYKVLTGLDFLSQARKDFNGKVVAHWLGNPKPWD